MSDEVDGIFGVGRKFEELTGAIRLNPNDAEAYCKRGNVYCCRGYTSANNDDYDAAIADYTEAIQRVPDFMVAYYNRGVAYFYKGDYDKAVADYSEAVRLGWLGGSYFAEEMAKEMPEERIKSNRTEPR